MLDYINELMNMTADEFKQYAVIIFLCGVAIICVIAELIKSIFKFLFRRK